MKKPLILLSLIASLGAGTGYAQSADGGDPAAQPADPGIELGQPVRNEPYIKEVYDDWTLECIKDQADNEACTMVQLLKDPQNNQDIAQVEVKRVENAGQIAALVTVIVPLESSLKHGLKVSIDGREGKQYPYDVCSRIGCMSRYGLLAEDVEAYKAGNVATITIVPFLAMNQPIPLSLSLKGFTAALAEVSVVRP